MSLSSLSSLSDGEDIVERRQRRNDEKFKAFEEYNEAQFKARFRLNKDTVKHLCTLMSHIQPLTKRNHAIQAVDQILITLRFFATGTYQRVIGDIFKVEQPTVHRIVHRVAKEICKLKNMYIKMPSPSERIGIASEFFGIAGMPRVMGAVDCTHIKIKSPGGPQAEMYRNRKGYFSLNVQMVCDTRLMVHNIIARWPGSVHDSTIFNDSPLCAQLERGDYGSLFLLGDSGYPCRNFLLTPILNPISPSQEAYNRAQIATRNPVERLFGVMKRRFPCLQIGLQVKLENVPNIITACAILHNIALSRQDLFDDETRTENAIREDDIEPALGIVHNENFLVRNMIILLDFIGFYFIGVMKRRFPCLQIGLQVKLENVPNIITACAILHNIALSRQDLFDDETRTENAIREDDIEPALGIVHNENFLVRNMIINTYFN